jgi:hypothetical protein
MSTEHWWVKLSNDIPNNPKIVELSDKLYRTWTYVLFAASKNDGFLPPLKRLAIFHRLSEKETLSRVNELIKAQLIDKVGDALRPHNWDKWQKKMGAKDPKATERQRRWREKEKDEKHNVYNNGGVDVYVDGAADDL